MPTYLLRYPTICNNWRLPLRAFHQTTTLVYFRCLSEHDLRWIVQSGPDIRRNPHLDPLGVLGMLPRIPYLLFEQRKAAGQRIPKVLPPVARISSSCDPNFRTGLGSGAGGGCSCSAVSLTKGDACTSRRTRRGSGSWTMTL